MTKEIEKMVEPISPEEVVPLKEKQIPDFVIEAFNELIAENFNNGSSTFTVKDVKQRIAEKIGSQSETLGGKPVGIKSHWLDIEPIFESKGWKVEYDKPGYNENYDAYWVFKAVLKR